MSKSRQAFSLLELLAVLLILSIAAVLVLPAFNTTKNANDLTNASQLASAHFSQARQAAIARNRNVEVRLYKFLRMGQERYRAFQIFIDSDSNGTWRPTGRLENLPQGICFDSGAALSPLISTSTELDGIQSKVTLPGISSYRYVRFTFRPDGSVVLDQSQPSTFLTLLDVRTPKEVNKLPANYSMIQIFTARGALRVYRP